MREYVSNKDRERWDELREEFEQAQAGGCAICREPLTATRFMDHNHSTGFVRGVLCSSCNTKLGWYEKRHDQIDAYLARAAYYDAHSTIPSAS